MKLNVTGIASCCDKEKCFNRWNDYSNRFPNFNIDLLDNVDDVCTTRMSMYGYKNKLECCDTVRFFMESVPDDLQKSKTGNFHKYLLEDNNKNRFDVMLYEVNRSEKYMDVYKYYGDFSLLKPGEFDFICTLDFDKLPGAEKLKQLDYEGFPEFHEAHVVVVEKAETYLHLRFSGGFNPFVIDIKMDGIFKEEFYLENDTDLFEHFSCGHGAGRVEVLTMESYFVFRLSDSYESSKSIEWYEGLSLKEIAELQANPRYIKTKRHLYECIIYCKNIHFDFARAPE